jgi:hypothetical protein
MMAIIVVPAGARSIAMTRACLVSGRTTGLDEARADRARDLLLLIFLGAERVATLVFDLGLVMGSSEVGATPSAAPPQPRPGKLAGRARSRSRLSRSKSSQQCSDQARKPVNSEQDCCSIGQNPMIRSLLTQLPRSFPKASHSYISGDVVICAQAPYTRVLVYPTRRCPDPSLDWKAKTATRDAVRLKCFLPVASPIVR